MPGCVVGCQYMPSIEFFAQWKHYGEIIIEAHEHYQKKSWRNRTAILGTNGPLYLSVPLKKGKHHETPIREVEISYDEDWPRIHLHSIHTAYGKSAFFDELESDLKRILYSEQNKLWDLNLLLLQWIADLIPGTWNYQFTDSYSRGTEKGFTDLRSGIPAGIYSTPRRTFPEYIQVNRMDQGHLPNLSILDGLCHLGPRLNTYLGQYAQMLHTE